MPLTRRDALRLLHFCLAADDSCSAELGEDGAASVTIAPADPSVGVRTFEAPTFDEALRRAADAGLLKSACVEKQITFLTGGAGAGEGARAAATPVPKRRLMPNLFPRLSGATAALLHETQVERGMSAILAASDARHFRRELRRQRERTDSWRARWLALRRELAPVLGTALARRFEAVDMGLREMAAARSAIDQGNAAPHDVVSVYSSLNARLLSVGDAALGTFATAAQHGSALAYVVLLYAKEKTGIERARFGAAFATRTFSDDDRQALAGLLAARRSYLHVFRATAPRAADQLLEHAMTSSAYTDLARAEDLILAGRERELDLDARTWFQLASRKINLLGEIGVATLDLVGAPEVSR
jgi:nitrate/nitrite sensing protein